MRGEYVHFQPNIKDTENNQDDCIVRVLCHACDCTWQEAFAKLAEICIHDYIMPSTYGALDKALQVFGGCEKPSIHVPFKTVAECAGNGINGVVYCVDSLARDGLHVVAVGDGKYYDAFDSGDMVVVKIVEKKSEK